MLYARTRYSSSTTRAFDALVQNIDLYEDRAIYFFYHMCRTPGVDHRTATTSIADTVMERGEKGHDTK